MYKVVPFRSKLPNSGNGTEISTAIEEIVNKEFESGWSFVQIQELTTHVSGTNGCFGFFAEPSRTIYLTVLIFRRESK